MLERKIRYNGMVAEYECQPLLREGDHVVLFYLIPSPFEIELADRCRSKVAIPNGCYTIAHYWSNRPYNIYIWKDQSANCLGAYFNIVRNTTISEEGVSYEDLIIDLLVLPDGSYYVLDEDELPEPLADFEKGTVYQALQSLIESKDSILAEAAAETARLAEKIAKAL